MLKQSFLIIIVLVSMIHIKSKLTKERVLFAINCGGNAFTDSKGIFYHEVRKIFSSLKLKDRNFKGGQTSELGTNSEFKLTEDSTLYQTERWGSENFQYLLPLKDQGKHVLILKFSEVYFNSPGEKIFDIGLGDTRVVNKLDIYSKVGKTTAYDEFIEFEFKNGKIYFEVNF